MPTLAVLTSGGDAPGMNCAVGAATKLATGAGWQVLGVQNGYEGLIDGDLRPLHPSGIGDAWNRGGTMLGTARSQRFMTVEGRAQAAAQLRHHGVDGLIIIGGNGSLTGAHLLCQEHGVATVGVPASIDHDLACTSYAIGVDTALNTIVQACDRISDTARSHRRVFLVEVMGRQCGYLAMAAAIGAAADAVIFREQGKDEEVLVAELRALVRRAYGGPHPKKRVLIIKAEGVEVPTERLATRLDAHAAQDAPGVAVRYTVLGHVVRGGAPSFRDRLLGGRLAFGAFSALASGATDAMVGWQPSEAGGVPTRDPAVHTFPLDTVLTQTQQLIQGTHPTTLRRVAMLEAVQGVLPL